MYILNREIHYLYPTMEQDYREINRKSWNNRVDAHFKSDFYNVTAFLNGKSSLNAIELDLLGDIQNKSVLHLQCHFGQDSISLARLGAKVTGVDLSDKAIQTAQELNTKTNTDVDFICCDIYDLPNYCTQQFDIIYTSYGTIGWLPDLNKWAAIIAQFLKPGGKFIFVEFHPVVWMFDDDFSKIKYTYHNSGQIVENETGTYADKQAAIQQDYVMWNHGLAEVFTALLHHNLSITNFQEFDYSPYNCFNKTIEFEPGKFRIEHLENKIPMVYALTAVKK
ncbi:MAG: class I SAM-dependent methyltransferase [Chitinophagales bacterium]